MKKLFLPLIALTCLISSCEKEDDKDFQPVSINQDSNIDVKSNFNHLSFEEYDRIKSAIETDLSKLEKHNSNILNSEDLSLNTPNLISRINSVDKIVRKHPELIEIRSMLDIYHEALLKDKSELEEFAKKYSSFLTYFKEVNGVILRFPIAKAALLNEDGIIQFDNKIVQYFDGKIKIIEDGDASKINLLEKTNTSNNLITVINAVDENQKLTVHSSGIHTHQTFYQAAWAEFTDVEFVTCNYNVSLGDCDEIPTFKLSIGTNVSTYFLGQLNVVSNLNINMGYSINTNCGNFSGLEYSGAVNTSLHGSIDQYLVNCGALNGLSVQSANIVTGIYVQYANGVNFLITV